MPRRKTHIRVGVPAGAITAAYRAPNQTPAGMILEAVGGGIGGWIGAQMPDKLEPASMGWNHRSFCHSWSTLIATMTCSDGAMSEWEYFCRQKAKEAAQQMQSDASLTEFDRFFLSMQTIAWQIAASVLAGLIAGYVSHLVLDAGTPNELPVFS